MQGASTPRRRPRREHSSHGPAAAGRAAAARRAHVAAEAVVHVDYHNHHDGHSEVVFILFLFRDAGPRAQLLRQHDVHETAGRSRAEVPEPTKQHSVDVEQALTDAREVERPVVARGRVHDAAEPARDIFVVVVVAVAAAVAAAVVGVPSRRRVATMPLSFECLTQY